MRNLIHSLRDLQPKLQRLRGRALKETPTRAIFIDPILEALGWDVRDPDAVELEYATADRQVVDYALKLDHEPVLLVEAKSLGDPLTSGRAVTQVTGYAAKMGVVWCILTNGARWQVYRSLGRGEPRPKPVFEVSLDPREDNGATLPQIAERMWRFSRDGLAGGKLDDIGRQASLDDRVRKGLDGLMTQPPPKLVRAVREILGDHALTSQGIQESLVRVWSRLHAPSPNAGARHDPTSSQRAARPRFGCSAHASHREGSGGTHRPPRAYVDLYHTIGRLCLATAPGVTAKRQPNACTAYSYRDRDFCWLSLGPGTVNVALRMRSGGRRKPARSRHGEKTTIWKEVVVLTIDRPSQLDVLARLVQRAFDSLAGH